MTRSLVLFGAAAILEIAGCFAFWHWMRRGGTAWWLIPGVASLIGFAMVLARIDSPFAGRAYAAYGGIYIATALAWLWLAEGHRPTLYDLLGAALAIAGALVILWPVFRR